jgi:glyoxylase-like metal-dependent hydrolase (beta-lactamase superfamily II)
MKLLAPGVWQLQGFPRDLFNVYLVEDVLIDTATRWAYRRIVRQLRGRSLRLVALTHCHPDHQGSARAICKHFRVPLACHELDVPSMEGRTPMQPDNRMLRLGLRVWAGPPHPVAHPLREGDEIAGFRVVHAPGHTPGHIMLFRASDRVALAGDVLANIHFLTGQAGLREPPPFFSTDPWQNRHSVLRLAELQPALVCFGHGPPLRDMHLLQQFAARLRERIQTRSAVTDRIS